jgi:hypothetical protein
LSYTTSKHDNIAQSRLPLPACVGVAEQKVERKNNNNENIEAFV